MLPVIALIGRPNVGKSTLFNRLTRSRDALVADQPGLTRDRKYGIGKLGDHPYLVVDTGGLSGDEAGIDGEMAKQSVLAAEEAHVTLFLVDARAGITVGDEAIANWLRRMGKRVHLVLNKVDGLDQDVAAADFFSLGLGDPIPIAAAHGRGVHQMIDEVLGEIPEAELAEPPTEEEGVKVAVVGRPNVGKSTLINRILGEERVVAFDQPGTTRDSVFIPFERDDTRYTLIDTAGVRRRGRVKEAVEKFSAIKTLQAIESAHVVIMVLDAREGITEQDAGLLGFILDAGRALVVAINKWDGLATEQKEKVKKDVDIRLPFLDFARLRYISALHGTGVGELFKYIDEAYRNAMRKFPTPELTRLLEDAYATHQPPQVGGRSIKLRYAHQGGSNPPIIIVHGNRVDKVPESYRRYLTNTFRKVLKLVGTPLRVEFRGGENPYKDRKNTLTPRQQAKRKRLVKHLKGRKK
ncbi:ribosome biogenesis GTPase Der [Endothiovibrio diazotrophicus]